MVKKQFDWKILAKKFGVNTGAVIIAGLAAVYGDNPMYLAIAPILKALQNFLKHKYGFNI